MAKIFYSMAGEGRGHAVRVLALVEQLRYQHELVLFAPGDAYEFLVRKYGDGRYANVKLIRVLGLNFHYTGGRLDLFKSTAGALRFAVRELPTLVQAMCRQIEIEQPDLAIADFEPILPRAAKMAGLPWMSLDHQHVLLAYDLGKLPLVLRRYAWWMSWAVRWFYGWDNAMPVVSSFYSPPLKPGFEQVRQVGPMLRSEIVSARPTTDDYLLSYLRPNTPAAVIEALAACGRPVRVYGLGAQPPRGQLTYHAIDEQKFANDVTHCHAIVSAAGNQLLGEAMHLGKPFFALPEYMHHEQQINACFLKQMGAGDWTIIDSFRPERLMQFLNQLDQFRTNLIPRIGQMNGTPDALSAIENRLPHRHSFDVAVPA